MRRNSGFTLIEVVIATVLIMTLLGGFLQLLTSQARVASEESQETNAQSGLITTIQSMLPLLEEAKLIDREDVRLPTDPSRIYFYVPMKTATGTIQTQTSTSTGRKEVQVGAGDPAFDSASPLGMHLGDYYEMIFIPSYDTGTGEGRADQLIDEATVSRSNGVLGVDLNGNGNKTDKFVYGTMVLRHWALGSVPGDGSAPVNERFLGGRIAVPASNKSVFSLFGQTQLTITLNSLDIRVKGEESRLRTTGTIVKLRGNGAPK